MWRRDGPVDGRAEGLGEVVEDWQGREVEAWDRGAVGSWGVHDGRSGRGDGEGWVLGQGDV